MAAADGDHAPDRRRGRSALAALPAAAALAAVALIAAGLVLVLGEEEPASQRRGAAPPIRPTRVATKPSAPGSPPLRVFVLDGTEQDGLAASAAEALETGGATIVGTATAGRSDVLTSSIYAARGVDVTSVAGRLGIRGAPRPLTPARRAQGPGADVVVVLGTDLPPIGTGATGASGAAGFPQQQVNLRPPHGGEALGFALIAEGGLALQAEHLPESDRYGVYLYTSRTDALPLGFAQYDAKSGHVAGAITTLPAEAAGYAEVVITRQPGRALERPGPIVLRGRLRRR